MRNTNPTKPLLVFGLGVVAGWIAKHWFESPEMSQQRKKILANVDEIKTRLEESDPGQRIKEIFGQVSDEATAFYEQARARVIDEVAALQVSLEDIDKQKYVSIVNGIVNDLRRDSELSEDQLTKLTKALSSDFNKLKQRRSSIKRRQELAEEVE